MNEDKNVKVVSTNLNTGIAKPIVISREDAINIARSQNIKTEEVTEVSQSSLTGQQQMGGVAEAKPITREEQQKMDIERLNEINDLVRVKDVKPVSKKTVVIMVLVLVLIIAFFIFVELPLILGE